MIHGYSKATNTEAKGEINVQLSFCATASTRTNGYLSEVCVCVFSAVCWAVSVLLCRRFLQLPPFESSPVLFFSYMNEKLVQ